MELVMKPGNDVCADCKARAPRWASFNIGIFICMNCASIHRKIGTHITKVKSLSLDEWSKEQVEFMKQNGNLKSNQLYNPDEVRHPPPANLMGTERDSELEKFIRAKYEYKRFMGRKPPSAGQGNAVVPPPRTASASPFTQLPRGRSAPSSRVAVPVERKTSPTPPPLPEKTPENMPSRIFSSAAGSSLSPSLPSATFPQHSTPPARAVSQPLPSSANGALATKPTVPSKGGVWDELISLQGPAQNSSLPLQYQPSSHSPMAPLSSLPTPASSAIMTPTGLPQPRTFPTLDMPPNPFVNMSVTGAGVSTGYHFNTAAAPLGTPTINLPTVNTNMNPFTGASLFTSSSLTNGATCIASPNPFSLGFGSASGVGTGMTNPPQSFGNPSLLGPLTPSLVPHPTGLFSPQPQTPALSTLPFSGGAISAPPTPSPYSTPFMTSGTLPQQRQPFERSSPSFLQPQMQFQSPTDPQTQQQAFGHNGLFSGWWG
ncbi:ArfGap-domain-containing protein [Pisolithus croceorrhizus]|nr:ArfGap-domain-containing protein [Pisolithus croceorrhizus]